MTLVVFGLVTRQPWPAWVSGLFFGAMIGFGALWQSELEDKNRQLEQAQGEVRVLAAAAERERIARDLHDLLGHTLTVVAVKADLAERLCDRDLEAARREMRDLAAVARDALSEVRTAVVGMKGASLAVEIERAGRALSAAGVRAEVRGATAGGDPQREAVIAMALREAVTNVSAGASGARTGPSASMASGGSATPRSRRCGTISPWRTMRASVSGSTARATARSPPPATCAGSSTGCSPELERRRLARPDCAHV